MLDSHFLIGKLEFVPNVAVKGRLERHKDVVESIVGGEGGGVVIVTRCGPIVMPSTVRVTE